LVIEQSSEIAANSIPPTRVDLPRASFPPAVENSSDVPTPRPQVGGRGKKGVTEPRSAVQRAEQDITLGVETKVSGGENG
jgi:hypothetical protein